MGGCLSACQGGGGGGGGGGNRRGGGGPNGAASRRSSAYSASADASVKRRLPGFGMESHYRTLQLLGAGGTGSTYLCEDVRDGRRVAIKFISRCERPGRAWRGRGRACSGRARGRGKGRAGVVLGLGAWVGVMVQGRGASVQGGQALAWQAGSEKGVGTRGGAGIWGPQRVFGGGGGGRHGAPNAMRLRRRWKGVEGAGSPILDRRVRKRAGLYA